MRAVPRVGVFSRENGVIVLFVALAVVTLFVVAETGDRPTWVGSAVLLGVGVIAPLVVNRYLDRRAAA